jgi:dihydroorotate dehydrogenase (fumarate)
MANLKTKYMGIELDNPIILGASSMSKDLDKLKKAEELGIAAIVYRSLFEEQVQLERLQLGEKLTEFNDINAEMLTIHPKILFAGPDEHLFNLRKTKESLSIPVIASLNAVNSDTWIKYAKLISETGVDGIELNFYHIPSDFIKDAKEIEDEQAKIVETIKKDISIPISVKLSPDYSNILNFIKRLDQTGTDAFVLFNSFFQPDIDIVKEQHIKSFNFSNEGDYKESLRYSGLIFENIKADVCSSLGIFTGADVIKLILSGSSCVQGVSTFYKNGLEQITKIKTELLDWMDAHHYNSIDEFRGKLSKNKLDANSFAYKRTQYVDLLMDSDDIFGDTK